MSHYLGYLQFSVVNKEAESIQDLVNFAFTDSFERLPWLARIHALDIASKIKHPRFKD